MTVDGQPVKITHPDRLMYPNMTKTEVIEYFVSAAPALLPALAQRPLTRRRWPDGTQGAGFFEKAAPRGMPDWVRTADVTHHRSTVTYPIIERACDLAWLGQVGALEFHVPQWRLDHPEPRRLIIDLDPGPPAGLAQAAEVAIALRDLLETAGLSSVPVTSGSKGIHVYADVGRLPKGATTSDLAKQIGQRLQSSMESLVVTNMSRTLRADRVLIDWSQNSPAKTTVCPYSLRGTTTPYVAAPRTWAEIEPVEHLRQLTPSEVLKRLAEGIDTFAHLAEI